MLSRSQTSFLMPNYYLTKSTDDPKELTDGLVYRHPAWKGEGSVGWKDASSIKLDINLPKADKVVCQSGILKIYSGKKIAPALLCLDGIDIYEQGVHLKEIVIDNDHYKDDQAHIISTELAGIKNQLTLVIHSNGRFTMLDEVAWEPDLQCLALKAPPGTTKVFDVVADSKQRLIKGMEGAARPLTGEKSFYCLVCRSLGQIARQHPKDTGVVGRN